MCKVVNFEILGLWRKVLIVKVGEIFKNFIWGYFRDVLWDGFGVGW